MKKFRIWRWSEQGPGSKLKLRVVASCRPGPCRSSRICGPSCTKRRTAARRRSSTPTRRSCKQRRRSLFCYPHSVTPRRHWFTGHVTSFSWNYYVCALLSCMWRILEGTKGYICDAVVAVIDHLGTVSSKLEHKLQEKTDVTLTERKINFLKQVGLLLFTCKVKCWLTDSNFQLKKHSLLKLRWLPMSKDQMTH